MDKIKKTALTCVGLKAGQQVLNDLDAVVMNNTNIDLVRYGIEQYACRLGSAVVGAFCLDRISSKIEKILPKVMQGSLPLVATTLGTAALINYYGDYINLEQGIGVKNTLTQLIGSYTQSIRDITSLNPETNAGYLMLSALTLKSGLRWLQNITSTLNDMSKTKEIEEKQTRLRLRENRAA